MADKNSSSMWLQYFIITTKYKHFYATHLCLASLWFVSMAASWIKTYIVHCLWIVEIEHVTFYLLQFPVPQVHQSAAAESMDIGIICTSHSIFDKRLSFSRLRWQLETGSCWSSDCWWLCHLVMIELCAEIVIWTTVLFWCGKQVVHHFQMSDHILLWKKYKWSQPAQNRLTG